MQCSVLMITKDHTVWNKQATHGMVHKNIWEVRQKLEKVFVQLSFVSASSELHFVT